MPKITPVCSVTYTVPTVALLCYIDSVYCGYLVSLNSTVRSGPKLLGTVRDSESKKSFLLMFKI
jgi:hypothetical protein